MIVRYCQRGGLRRRKNNPLSHDNPLPDRTARLADGAMPVIMMMVLALPVKNCRIRSIATAIIRNAQAMLRTLLLHLVLMRQWQKPCQNIA